VRYKNTASKSNDNTLVDYLFVPISFILGARVKKINEAADRLKPETNRLTVVNWSSGRRWMSGVILSWHRHGLDYTWLH